MLRAFVDTKVSKTELIASLERHAAADRIVRGAYWEEGKGCAVGCAIHDFAPGKESSHLEFERLFGIAEGVAHLNDRIFESLPRNEARSWPLAFVRAIRPGSDTTAALDRWLLWLLSSDWSPISAWREKRWMAVVADIYRGRLSGHPQPEAASASASAAYYAASAASAASAAAYAASAAASGIAADASAASAAAYYASASASAAYYAASAASASAASAAAYASAAAAAAYASASAASASAAYYAASAASTSAASASSSAAWQTMGAALLAVLGGDDLNAD